VARETVTAKYAQLAEVSALLAMASKLVINAGQRTYNTRCGETLLAWRVWQLQNFSFWLLCWFCLAALWPLILKWK